MKDTDAVIVVAFVAAMQPAQQFSKFTPDAWAMVLADVPVDLETAKAAVVRLAKQKVWFSPGEIRAEILRALPPSALATPAPVRAIMRGDEETAQGRIDRNRRGADAARAAVKPFPGRRQDATEVPENLKKARAMAAADRLGQAYRDKNLKLGRAGAEALKQINHQRALSRSRKE